MASLYRTVDDVPTREEVERARGEAEASFVYHRFRAALHTRRQEVLDHPTRPRPCDRFTRESLRLETKAAEDSARSRLNHSLRVYAGLSCRELTNKVVTVLPREVRDIIYAYILDRAEYAGSSDVEVWKLPRDVYVAPRDTNDPLYPPLVCVKVMDQQKHVHCWHRGSCGTQFVQELIQTCYGQTKFKFTQDSLHLLAFFLGINRPPTVTENPGDIVLPFEHVKKLRFYLESAELDSTLFAFQSLRELKRKAKIELFLEIQNFRSSSQDPSVAVQLKEMVQHLFPLFCELIDYGHEITLRFATRGDFDRATNSNDYDKFSWFRRLEYFFQEEITWGLCDAETALRLYNIRLVKKLSDL